MAEKVTRSKVTSRKDGHLHNFRPGQLEPNEAMRYTDAKHCGAVLSSLSRLRSDGHLTDITLKVDQERFACHRNVLAACSPYFLAMFTGNMQESTCSVITIHKVESTSMDLILDFVYTGGLKLNNDNVQSVFGAANLLQVETVVRFCAEYMEKNLHQVNCVDVYQLACTYSCLDLKEAAWEFVNYHIQDIIHEAQLVNASLDVIADLAQSSQLNVTSEDTVLKMVLAWVQWDPLVRTADLARLLGSIQLEQVSAGVVEQFDLSKDLRCVVRDALRKACDDRTDKVGDKPRSRLGMTAQDVLLLMGRSVREYVLCCFHPPSQASFFIELPRTCRAFGGKIAVTDANEIYLATDDYREKSVFRYNHVQARWIEVAPMLLGRSNFSLVASNGRLFALGGLNDWEILRSVEWYDPVRDEWRLASAMPRDVIDFSAVAHGDSIYVFSGSRTMTYCLETDAWLATLTPMPTPRLQAACAAKGSEIWVIGGFLAQSTSEVPTVCVESYAPAGDAWTKREVLPCLLRFCSAVCCQPTDRLHLCGMWCGVHEMGLNIPVQLSSQFDVYDLDELTNSWADMAFDIPMQEVESCATARIFKR